MAREQEQVKVLVVAEATDFTRKLEARLRAEGCLVETVRTGAAAVDLAARRFDLILLDLKLPDGDSLPVLRQLRGQDANALTPIFLLKGEGEPAHVIQRGFDTGASGFVSKHRLPHHRASDTIVSSLIRATSLFEVYEAGNGGSADARPDTCPYSSRREFGRCPAFLPLSIAPGAEDVEALVSCSHLRIGTSDTWRLYPRCAIGDQAARDRYLEDSAPRLGD